MLHYGYPLPQVLAAQPRLRTFTILREDWYSAPLIFYVAALREQGVQPIVLTATAATLQHLRPGQQLLICSEPLQRYVQQHYYTQPLAAVSPCALITISGSK